MAPRSNKKQATSRAPRAADTHARQRLPPPVSRREQQRLYAAQPSNMTRAKEALGVAGAFASRIVKNVENWWFFLFLLSGGSYMSLLDAALAPAALAGARVDGAAAAFAAVVPPAAVVKVLVDGLDAGDAALWRGDGAAGQLLFGEAGANRVWVHEDGSGLVRVGHSVFLQEAGCAAGCEDFAAPGAVCLLDYDADGPDGAGEPALLACEQGGRRLSRVKQDGVRVPVASTDAAGDALNGPSSAALGPNGTVFFADAHASAAGASKRRDATLADRGAAADGVYALSKAQLAPLVADGAGADAAAAAPTRVAAVPGTPEALAFNADYTALYVADSAEGAVFAFDVDPKSGAVDEASRSVFFDLAAAGDGDDATGRRAFRGLAVDALGRVFATGPRKVYVLGADGALLGAVATAAEQPVDLAVAGDGHLYVVTETMLLRVPLARGVAPPKLPK